MSKYSDKVKRRVEAMSKPQAAEKPHTDACAARAFAVASRLARALEIIDAQIPELRDIKEQTESDRRAHAQAALGRVVAARDKVASAIARIDNGFTSPIARRAGSADIAKATHPTVGPDARD